MRFAIQRVIHTPFCNALCVFCFFIAGISGVYGTELRVNRLFADHMVLQRDRPLPVWGEAKAGEKVSVNLGGQSQSTQADANGHWRVELPPMAASAVPVELLVKGEAKSLQIPGILVGDVWLCGGDFGVFYEMFKATAASKEIPAANHPQLRLFKVPKKSSNTPLEETDGEWRVCAPETVTDFSALAYFFGKALQRDLNVPIGLIDASYPYSYARGWMPARAFAAQPELATPRRKMESWDPTTEAGKEALATTITQVEAWLPLAEEAFHKQQPIPPQPRLPAPIPADDSNYRSNGELSLNYNAMINPLVGFPLRGMIWSLGENGCLELGIYRFYLQALWQSWRQAWGQGDFPIYVELLPRMGKPDESPGKVGYYGLMREQQMLALDLVPNTAAAVTYDVSDYVADERNRQDAGERLARLALAGEYGKPGEGSGPQFQEHAFKDGAAIVTFTHTGSGLMAGKKDGLKPVQELANGSLKGFLIAGEDQKWHHAEAKIVGETVIVSNSQVPHPVAVRYAFVEDPGTANLYNREGLPALPFRTDQWALPQARQSAPWRWETQPVLITTNLR